MTGSQGRIVANVFQQNLRSCRLHVPIGDHQAIGLGAQAGERGRHVGNGVDLLEAHQHQEIADDLAHRPAVLDDQHRL
jgi:hypothetical protein